MDIEDLRSQACLIEQLENALCQALAYKEKFPKEQVVCDMLILKLSQELKDKACSLKAG